MILRVLAALRASPWVTRIAICGADRATLEAFYVRGQSLLQMSDEFDAPLGTIKRRLHVARLRLAKEVEPMAV